jgi:hypothetical protein
MPLFHNIHVSYIRYVDEIRVVHVGRVRVILQSSYHLGVSSDRSDQFYPLINGCHVDRERSPLSLRPMRHPIGVMGHGLEYST